MNTLTDRLQLALDARADLLVGDSTAALRLFAGFYEGYSDLVVDLYGQTLVLFDYSESLEAGGQTLSMAQDYLLENLPWVDCTIWKRRTAQDQNLRCGVVTFGEKPAEEISEHGIRYALDLLMNQDAGFYLDTRGLRKWLLDNATGWELLNTFAYTGSLGVAALAGGTAGVIQVDRNRQFLGLARQSGMLNRLDIGRMKLRAADFFSEVARLKHEKELFDCVIVDPPFFSSTTNGRIDLVNESVRVINKVRPLVKDDGYLVSINNALFLSGADYIKSLEELCQDGYLAIQELIPVPQDITGFPETVVNHPPSDPAPFNHSTKIVILRVKRK
jgi:23S rRNA (cytosine1962-C5)-methyltransferase